MLLIQNALTLVHMALKKPPVVLLVGNAR
jgi:hypothetical protein